MQLIIGIIIGVLAIFFVQDRELPFLPHGEMKTKTMYDLMSLRLDDIEKDVIHIRECSCK